MTVSYSQKCFNNGLATFGRLLFRWRGSIYKLLYKEALVFIFCFYALSVCFEFLDESQRGTFTLIVEFCQHGTNMLPITFVLGGFVSFVVSQRWWTIFTNIPYPDRVALNVATHIHGDDEHGRLIRRTIARYVVLSAAIVFRNISEPVKKRLPTLDHLHIGGLMTLEECERYKEIVEAHKKPTSINVYHMPIHWACTLVRRARLEKRIDNDLAMVAILKEISAYRSNLANLNSYDWITVPLVYTQVVTVAVYSFFLSCLMARQHDVDSDSIWLEMFFPVFTFLQFLFYMGWLKVAEVLMNPMGCDDDDFEMNYILDRSIKVAYMIVDKNCNVCPPLIKDKFWSELNPEIPNTLASEGRKNQAYRGSVADILYGTVFLLTVATDSLDLKHSPAVVRKRTNAGQRVHFESEKPPTSNLASTQEESVNDDVN